MVQWVMVLSGKHVYLSSQATATQSQTQKHMHLIGRWEMETGESLEDHDPTSPTHVVQKHKRPLQIMLNAILTPKVVLRLPLRLHGMYIHDFTHTLTHAHTIYQCMVLE